MFAIGKRKNKDDDGRQPEAKKLKKEERKLPTKFKKFTIYVAKEDATYIGQATIPAKKKPNMQWWRIQEIEGSKFLIKHYGQGKGQLIAGDNTVDGWTMEGPEKTWFDIKAYSKWYGNSDIPIITSLHQLDRLGNNGYYALVWRNGMVRRVGVHTLKRSIKDGKWADIAYEQY